MKKNSLLVLIFLGSLHSFVVSANNRIALVIGNNNYKESPLLNPVNDSRDISVKLRTLGFSVTELNDINKRQFSQAIRDFTQKLIGPEKIGLFFYAGHAVEIDGQNYLIPIETDISAENDVEYEAINAGRILSGMERAGNGLNMVILDACRNNPFRSLFRSQKRGIRLMSAPQGSIIIYSAQPGKVAEDGSGRNGTFTKHLLQQLDSPGSDVFDIFQQTAKSVYRETNGRQLPYIEGVVLSDFYFQQSSETTIAKVESPGPPNHDIQSVASITRQKQKSAHLYVDEMPEKQAFRDSLKNGETGPWMLDIKAGEFTMGGDYYNEKPRHKVIIKSDFAISAYEITVNDFKKFRANREVSFASKPEIKTVSPNQPVTNVSWDDAYQYTIWLSGASGKKYRLPSEAEWEFVARGAERESQFKLSAIDRHCAGCGGSWDNGGPTAVNLLDREIAGTRGMLGNVWEWTADCWIETYDGSTGDGQSRTHYQCGNRTLRGGSFNYSGRYSSPSSRLGVAASASTDYIGFRVVRDGE